MNTLYEYPNILDEGMNILLLVDGELALGNINYAKRPSWAQSLRSSRPALLV